MATAVAPPPATAVADKASRLEARGVSVHFEGLTALEDVDLTLSRAEILGLIGPNGAGKTTLVNVLTGFQRPDTGTVWLDSQDMTAWPPYRIGRAGLGRTFQAVRLFSSMTVLENVELGAVAVGMGRGAARARALELLDWLGLLEMAPLQADTLPFGAERQVGIARALAGHVRFLLLDEPAAGLNEAEADEMVRTVSRIPEEFHCGVLVIEHNMRLIMALCDRLHVLDEGRTIAIGTPAEVQEDSAVRRAYLGGEAESAAIAAVASEARKTESATILRIENLHANYGPIAALRGVSLEVRSREFVSVIGPNGAGKSTLLNAVAGGMAPTTGDIVFEGASLLGERIERRVARGISLVPEGRHIFPALTVAENLQIGATTQTDRAAFQTDFDRVLEHFPVLRHRLSSSAGKLSGGEQQQLVIARSLLARPKLLLIDEPSLGLAPMVIDLVYEILNRLRSELDLTILLVEQSAARALQAADRTYVLGTGLIRLSGTSEELHNTQHFDDAYFGFTSGDETTR